MGYLLLWAIWLPLLPHLGMANLIFGVLVVTIPLNAIWAWLISQRHPKPKSLFYFFSLKFFADTIKAWFGVYAGYAIIRKIFGSKK